MTLREGYTQRCAGVLYVKLRHTATDSMWSIVNESGASGTMRYQLCGTESSKLGAAMTSEPSGSTRLLRAQFGQRSLRIDRRVTDRDRATNSKPFLSCRAARITATHRQRAVEHRSIEVGPLVLDCRPRG